jgi:signal transduction histidine kinase
MHTGEGPGPDFLDRLVHDLREPLRSISVFSELLVEMAKGRLGEEGDRVLSEIPAGVLKIGALLEGLSGYSLALREPGEPVSAASLQSAFKIVVAELHERIRESGATVVGANLPRVNVSLERLMQIMRNLIGNSLRFRSDAAPVIRVSAELNVSGLTDGTTMWIIRVEDNGIGIAPEECEAVFKPFARLEGKKYGGVGLGLSSCKRIVEAHGGTIRMQPASAGGSICIFTLPEA